MSELQQITEVSKKDKLKLTQLQSEVTDTQSKIKVMTEVEQNLKNDLESQKEVFSQAGNPQYDSILSLEKSIKTQMDQIGEKLKDSFLKEVSDNNKVLEDRFNTIK